MAEETSYDTVFGKMALEEGLCSDAELKRAVEELKKRSKTNPTILKNLMIELGYMTTTVEFHPIRKEVLFHQGKSVENVDDDKACRSKLAAEVKGDIEKLMNEWDQWSWHRVTVYGDLKEPVRQFADAMKLRVVEEA